MDYFIKLQDGKKVAVSEGVYRAYKRPQWREEYHAEKEKERHIPYDKLIESDYQLKEHRFTLSASAEELARDVIAFEKLHYALKELTADERELVEELYFKQNSEREYEKSTGVPRKTVAYRREKILAKLRKLMDNK
ncbi:MAG: sigma-70 family RNA polymerase sigma factor [Desulfosporosinus sp.]|nr:sigma-70 family RNA polymerase sigma factor [Desulfosporosinus sp.]